MTLKQAIGFGLWRRRAGCSNWDDPKEFLMYMVNDIVAEDWEVIFPNGRIIEDFEYARKYMSDSPGSLSLVDVDFDGDDSGSSGPALV